MTTETQSIPQRKDGTHPTMNPEIDQSVAGPHFSQHDHQELRKSYGNHPVLDLEEFASDLGDRNARIALLLIGLVREDHDRSDDHVKELSKLFAPMRKRLDAARAVLEQKEVAFDEAESDVLKYEAFVGDLGDATADNARVLLHLARSNLKDKLEFSGLLNDLFSPLKQRNINEHATTCKFEGVFEGIESSTNHNGTDTAQST
jgi:hypothetical protein